MQGMMERIRRAPARAVDDIAKLVWKYHGAGHITDDQANEFAAAIEVRRRNICFEGVRRPRKRRLPSERVISRRKLAAAGPMHPDDAKHFSTAELAAMMIIAGECSARGKCTLSVDEVADRASVSPNSVRSAVRRACRLGLIHRQERKRFRKPNLTNVLRVVAQRLADWWRCRVQKANSLNHSYIKGSPDRLNGKQNVNPLCLARTTLKIWPSKGGIHVHEARKDGQRGPETLFPKSVGADLHHIGRRP